MWQCWHLQRHLSELRHHDVPERTFSIQKSRAFSKTRFRRCGTCSDYGQRMFCVLVPAKFCTSVLQWQ